MNQIDVNNTLVSTIVPAMNEEGNIEEFCLQFEEMRNKSGLASELIFVDDGSTDNTLDAIKKATARFDFVRYAVHQRNRGLTAALQTGFAKARGDIFVFYPADLQYKPEDIPNLVKPIIDGADVCAGWKQGKYSKRFVSTIYNWFSRVLFNLKVHDLNSVKAFRREVIEDIFLRKDWHRYLIVLAGDEGFHIEEVKVQLYKRTWGRTKFSLWRVPVGILDMLTVWFQIRFLKKPLLYFGLMGSMLLLLAFLVGAYAVYLRWFENEGFRPLLNLVMLLAGLGMGLFIMGFVLEAQTALKEEIEDLRYRLRKFLSAREDDTDN